MDDGANRAIDDLADEMLRCQLDASPLYASQAGYPEYLSELPDLSPDALAQRATRLERLRDRIEATTPAELDEERRITRTMMLRDIADGLLQIDARADDYTVAPIPQTGRAASAIVYLPHVALVTEADAEAYVERCRKVPGWLDQATNRLATGRDSGRTPVRRLVVNTIALLDTYLGTALTDDPLLAVADPTQAAPPHWRDRLTQVVRDEVRPALHRYRDQLAVDALPSARPDDQPGIAHLSDGADLYRKLAQSHTTTDHDTTDLHQIGLDQVALLTEEMRTLGERALGTNDFAEITTRLRKDPDLFFSASDEIMAAAQDNLARAQHALPDWLGIQPRADCVVVPMTPLESENGDLGHYQWPAPDGSRPGRFWLNTFNPASRPRFENQVLTFHESVPGHHTQLALAQEADQCEYRRHAHVTAYVEGWALYVERLADEMGLYTSDLDRLGMVSFDFWRACRLVVDTGMHWLGWSRQRAVDYMLAHSALTPKNIENEIDRYISWPGQALGYMVGRLELQRIRKETARRLGDRFLVRDFHTELLRHGPLPLTVLDELFAQWEGLP